MQLPIVFANNEQNLKSLPKKAHDAFSAAGGANLLKKRSIFAEVLLIE